MSGSREVSPDWLREFQVPGHSLLSLSSDSESDLQKGPVKNDTADFQGNTRNVDADEDEKKVPRRTSSRHLSNKPSARKSVTRGCKIGDQTPAKRRKTIIHKKRDEGGSEVEEESSDKQMDSHVQNHSVWKLSSDSDPDSDTAVKVESPSAYESAKLRGEENDEKDSFHTNSEDATNFSRKGKSPKNQFKKPDHVPIVKKSNLEFISSQSMGTPNVATTRKSPRKQLKQADHVSVAKTTLDTQEEKSEKMIDEHLQGEGDGNHEGKDVDDPVEVKLEKHVEPHVSTAMPLVLPEKVNRSKVLIECEGDSIDLSGDIGAVGRVIISDTSYGDHEMLLDLKGTIYKTTIVPSRTFCVVSLGQTEGKIEAIMNDFLQLKPQSNVYDAETMVEGTLDGFSFDSEDETDQVPKATSHQNDQIQGAEEQMNQKTKGKAEKKLGSAQKRVKAAGTKQPKRRKPQALKKGKGKK